MANSQWETIQRNTEIFMAIEERIKHLQDINDSLIRDGHDNSCIVESIATCQSILNEVKA